MSAPPYDATAELAIIGGAIVSPSLLADLTRMVESADFYDLGAKAVFAAIEARHRAGDPIDANVIKADTSGTPRAADVLAEAMVTHESSQTTLTHARRVADLAAVRRIAQIATATLGRINDDRIHDPALLLDDLESEIGNVTIPNDPRPPEGLWVAADLLAAEFRQPPWIAPGFLREEWRLLFVGAEGGGKSTMLRQVVTAIASGHHPFAPSMEIDPQPGLLIDVENPESVVRDGLAMMPNAADADLTILSRPGGIDIRQRRDRDLLHRVFAKVRPKIASIGPLYKLYRTDRGESDESAAVAAQNVLDELRVTYGCAMVLETHAPKGGPIRDLIPFGSSAWMRWPELGWKLLPCNETGTPDPEGLSVKIGRFRGDRVETQVPAWFDRAATGGWPWAPYWPHGIPKDRAA